jgi:hypothetical protein
MRVTCAVLLGAGTKNGQNCIQSPSCDNAPFHKRYIPLTTTLALLFCMIILILCSYRISYWVPIKLTHVPIPAVTRREDNSASCSSHPLCFYPSNFHQLEPPIHIYHEPKKIDSIEYNTKK